ncbi:dienelactone hydrolase family protein [Bosea sp. UNC402CLCol]|uniref:alpha/beta hydrolase n=1 Tax=Bosea sp. UNC402CLCol TaxID=1510531 RepID=UPI0009DE94E8|nr:dienelactone hydrolase family protein [Bosea sp. UNC402CLCol]
MRSTAIALSLLCIAQAANAQSGRRQIDVPSLNEPVIIESYESCDRPSCPAALILSGSKGFKAKAYSEIIRKFNAADLNVYLVHFLSQADIDMIAKAENAHARLAYYAKRLPDWIFAVRGVIAHLKAKPNRVPIGVLGISLGAQVASAASVGRDDIGALVLIDGALPSDHPRPVSSLPPLLLIWGSADQVFPLPVGRDMQRSAQRLGGFAALSVYENGAHDFFLKPGTKNADAATRDAIDFLNSRLSR